MRNPIYFLQRNIGIFPLTSALVGGVVGFAVGSTGRVVVDSISFLYDTALSLVRNPYSFSFNPAQMISSAVRMGEESLYRAAIDGTEAGAVYSAGSLLLAKKISGIFHSKKGGE